MRNLIIILLAAMFLAACNKDNNNTNPAESKPEVKADPKIEISYAYKENLGHGPNSKTDSAKIYIHKNALEKEFLLQAEVITQTLIPMFENLKSRVVMFSQRDGRLFLFEATQGLTVTDALEQKYLLAEFPIKETTEEGYIQFDFNRGMSKLFVMGDWRGHEAMPNFEEMFKAVPLAVSYIEDTRFNNKNQFVIKQFAQMAGENRVSAQIKYYLSPYAPNPEFEPSRAPFDFNQKGFFEASPIMSKNGNPISHSTKFNHKEPIVFAVSANTPADYKQAVKDGALYWNKAFGEKIVQVVDAPAGVSAPHSEYNVIQWVPWDSAGFAYADAQMDPRTGEILHAQVYQTSVFAFASRFRAKMLLNRLKSFDMSQLKRASLKGFETQALCDGHIAERLINDLQTLLNNENLSDDKFLEASKDYVREVVAHEVGHTLGLRHNFAGSLATNYPASERDTIMQQYLRDKDAPAGHIASSSVMEYNSFLEAMILGDQVEKALSAQSYDEKAIRFLYYGNDYTTQEWPLFCTDDHTVQGYADCKRFDIGRSVAEYAKSELKSQIDSVPYTIMANYIGAKSTAPDYPSYPIEKVTHVPGFFATTILAPRENLLSPLTDNGKLLKVHRKYPVVDAINRDRVKEVEINKIHEDMDKLGGMDKILSPIEPGFAEEQYQRFAAIVDSGRYTSGEGQYGETYDFSEREKNLIKERIKVFYVKLEEELIKRSAEQLAKYKYSQEEANYNLADLNASYIYSYTLATSDKVNEYEVNIPKSDKEFDEMIAAAADEESKKNLTQCKTNKKSEACREVSYKVVKLELPEFKTTKEARLAAAKLLSAERSEASTWNIVAKNSVKKVFDKTMQDSLQVKDFAEVKAWDLFELPRPVAQWILENQAVQTELNK